MEAALKVMEDENVVTIPSSIFGVEGFLRVTFVASPEKLREGIRRIRRALSAKFVQGSPSPLTKRPMNSRSTTVSRGELLDESLLGHRAPVAAASE